MNFSVLMAVYKGDPPLYFKAALFSNIDKQEILPFEFVLVADGALTADDICVENRFKFQLELLEANPELGCIFSSQAEFCNDFNEITGYKIVPTEHKDISTKLKVRCIIPHSVAFYKKELITKVGGYNENIGFLEDYDLHLRTLNKGCLFAAIKKPLVKVRVTEEQRRRRGGVKYAFNELFVRFNWWKSGLISAKHFFVYTPIYFFFRITPPSIKNILYNSVRRKTLK